MASNTKNNVKIHKSSAFSAIFALGLTGIVQAEGNALQGVKLGFGYDQGFGVAASAGKFNGFIGNDGIAVDYLFAKGKVNKTDPIYWYAGGGGYGIWGGGAGIRVPLGVEISFANTKEPSFAKHWDAYAQLNPNLKLTDKTKFGLDVGIGIRYQF